MSSIIKVEFPNNQLGLKRVYKVKYRQRNYEHDYATITFRDRSISPSLLRPGTPMKLTIDGKDLYGYLHDVRAHYDSNNANLEVGFIGASYVMRQAGQRVYRDVTADQIIADIAKQHNFAYKVTPHPRVYSQVSQAGMTDWEFMVSLAKQCGYFLRAENTALYFQPLLQDFDDYIHEATEFIKPDAGVKFGPTLYYFKPILGETLAHQGANKTAISVAGVDPQTGKLFKYTKQKRDVSTRKLSNPELFDGHGTHIVANSYSTAVHESYGQDEKSVFPYMADAEVTGSSKLRPGFPIYLSNLGPDYSGYWTVLSVEHEITEKHMNVLMHTTVLTVGTDSLGETISPNHPKRPASKAYRKIIANVKNTRIKPTTELSRGGMTIKQPSQVGLVSRVNRADISSKTLGKAKWVSSHGNLNTIKVFSSAPGPVRARMAINAARQ